MRGLPVPFFFFLQDISDIRKIKTIVLRNFYNSYMILEGHDLKKDINDFRMIH